MLFHLIASRLPSSQPWSAESLAFWGHKHPQYKVCGYYATISGRVLVVLRFSLHIAILIMLMLTSDIYCYLHLYSLITCPLISQPEIVIALSNATSMRLSSLFFPLTYLELAYKWESEHRACENHRSRLSLHSPTKPRLTMCVCVSQWQCDGFTFASQSIIYLN